MISETKRWTYLDHVKTLGKSWNKWYAFTDVFVDSILKNAPSSLHGSNISATDVLLDFIRCDIKLERGTIRALVHILVDILHRAKTLAGLDVDVGLILPAQIGIVWHDQFIAYRH